MCPQNEQTPRTVRELCRNVLERGDLASKLTPPFGPDGAALPDADPGPALHFDAPVRSAELAMTTGVGALPRPGRLVEAAARAECLARFAHHELMAVELFAWALLRWPELPSALRRGLTSTLADEQKHCRMYLERLAAHDRRLDDYSHNDTFWKHAAPIASADNPPAAFMAGMGLTLEQANLDFTLTYRDAFRTAGDEASARVCQAVHDDEIRHVRLAAQWLPRLSRSEGSGAAGERKPDVQRGEAYDEIATYETAVPFPLDAARAKGRRFERGPRREAGLSDAFIEHVRVARSPQERALPRRRLATPEDAE